MRIENSFSSMWNDGISCVRLGRGSAFFSFSFSLLSYIVIEKFHCHAYKSNENSFRNFLFRCLIALIHPDVSLPNAGLFSRFPFTPLGQPFCLIDLPENFLLCLLTLHASLHLTRARNIYVPFFSPLALYVSC